MKGTVLELFAASARSRGDEPALIGAQEGISYSELDLRSNQIANFLISSGVGRGSLVAISLERSPLVVVAILGALKAGAAYVPLDPVNPDERLRFILEDAGPAAVLTEAGLSPRFAGVLNVVEIDRDPRLSVSSPAPTMTDVTPTDLAYVIYTSGTTGKPKGVLIAHRNLERLMTASHPLFGFDETDVWVLFHSYAFDFAVWEMWGALGYGGTLVVPTQDVVKRPNDVIELLEREQVTVLCQTPSAFRSLTTHAGSEATIGPKLRWVIFGGERLDPRILRRWVDSRGDSNPALVNMYGITETTIHSTFRRITKADCTADSRSPIGTALPHLEIRLLGEDGEPVPDGEVGEIYVLGDGVADGYLNRPDLTSERFRTSSDGLRMYRSGDLAHEMPDGDLIYHGRVDTQVQIRGFRVELGEIESELRRNALVADAVVAYSEDPWGGRLSAYLVTAEGQRLSTEGERTIRTELAKRLPAYMIPASFTTIEKLPLTSNGKVDRSALPEPARGGKSAVDDSEGPSDTIRRLASIWTEFLKVEEVSRDTDFFEAGGHSLLAVEVMIRVREEFGIDIPLGTMYEHTTLDSLANKIDRLSVGTEEFLL